MNNLPRYRATKNNTAIGRQTYQKGEEFDYEYWPACRSGAVDPINDAAKRIVHQMKKPDHDPASTWNFDHCRFFVPHYLPSDFRHGRKPPLPDKELPGMPRYRALWPGNYAGREVNEGDEIAYCGWPTDELEPVNDEADRVVEYYALYQGHGKLLPSPFCDLTGELFLPEFFNAAQKESYRRREARVDGRGPLSSVDLIQTPPLNGPAPVISARTHRGGGRRRVA